jgi:hypothetical protein
MGPETVEPSPYWIEKVPLFFELVEEGEYLCLLEQVELVHEELGIHKSEEPVSKSMRNDWEPTEIVPAHSSSLSSSVRGSDAVARFWREAGTVLNSLISKSLGKLPALACRARKFFWYLL